MNEGDEVSRLRGATSLSGWLTSRNRQTPMPTAHRQLPVQSLPTVQNRRHRRIKCSADPVVQATVSLCWWDSQTVACFESILRVRFFGPTTFHQGRQLFEVVGPDVQQLFWLSRWHCTQPVACAQNTGENGRQKHMAEPNTSLCRTLSLAAGASARVTAAQSLGSCSGPFVSNTFFGVRKLRPCSRRYLMLLKPDCGDILETVKWIALCLECGQWLCLHSVIFLSQCQFGNVHEALCWYYIN